MPRCSSSMLSHFVVCAATLATGHARCCHSDDGRAGSTPWRRPRGTASFNPKPGWSENQWRQRYRPRTGRAAPDPHPKRMAARSPWPRPIADQARYEDRACPSASAPRRWTTSWSSVWTTPAPPEISTGTPRRCWAMLRGCRARGGRIGSSWWDSVHWSASKAPGSLRCWPWPDRAALPAQGRSYNHRPRSAASYRASPIWPPPLPAARRSAWGSYTVPGMQSVRGK